MNRCRDVVSVTVSGVVDVSNHAEHLHQPAFENST